MVAQSRLVARFAPKYGSPAPPLPEDSAIASTASQQRCLYWTSGPSAVKRGEVDPISWLSRTLRDLRLPARAVTLIFQRFRGRLLTALALFHEKCGRAHFLDSAGC